MSRGKGRRRGGHDEEHANHERWLVSYADMMTVLMILFIVLFAIGQVDQRKFAMLREGLASGFGSTVNVPISGGTGIRDSDGVVPAPVDLDVGLGVKHDKPPARQEAAYQVNGGGPTTGTSSAAYQEAVKEVQRLAAIERTIRAALRHKGLQGDVRFRVDERGLVIALVSDEVFFENASAALRPRGRQVLEAVTPAIRPLSNQVAVEGHANHLTVTGGIYPTNWELSGARAAGVVRWLAGPGGLRETRLSATGYGSSRPLYRADDQRAIRFNRRVDLVLVSNQPPEVRELLRRLGPELSNL